MFPHICWSISKWGAEIIFNQRKIYCIFFRGWKSNTESAQPKKREDTYINSEICSSVNFPARTMLSSVCFNRAVDLKCKFLTFLTFKICENYVSPFSNWITSSMLMWSLIPWSLIHFASLDNDFFLLELSWDSGEKLRDHFE